MIKNYDFHSTYNQGWNQASQGDKCPPNFRSGGQKVFFKKFWGTKSPLKKKFFSKKNFNWEIYQPRSGKKFKLDIGGQMTIFWNFWGTMSLGKKFEFPTLLISPGKIP